MRKRYVHIETTDSGKFLVKSLERFDGSSEWVPQLCETMEQVLTIAAYLLKQEEPTQKGVQ